MCVPLTGGRSGPTQAGLWLSLWFSFRLRKEKRTMQNKTAGGYRGKSGRFAFEKMSNFVDICRISANLLHPFPKCDRINHHHFPGVGGWDITFGKGGNGYGEQRLAINGTSGDAAPYGGGHAAAAGRGAAGRPKRVYGFLFGSFSFTERKRTEEKRRKARKNICGKTTRR